MPSTSVIPFPRYARTDTVRFAHLFPRDRILWLKFLDSELSKQYIGFDYDIKVGQYAQEQISVGDSGSRLVAGTLAKRIDVVAFRSPSLIDIVEVKPGNPQNAIGQLLLYEDLFGKTYPQLQINQLVLVCEREDQEVITFAKSLRIVVVVFLPS